MNDNVKAWVEALRSGEYKQGMGCLTTVADDGSEYNCCLGVACKLAVEAGVIKAPKGNRAYDGGVYYRDGDDVQSAILPDAVRAWLGLATTDSTFYREDGTQEKLTSLNDGGTSFERIATIIESNPEGLFVTEYKL
jgi:hypothetical protein